MRVFHLKVAVFYGITMTLPYHILNLVQTSDKSIISELNILIGYQFSVSIKPLILIDLQKLEDLPIVEAFAKIIQGKQKLLRKRHAEYGTFFSELTYQCVPPHSQKRILKEQILSFLTDKGKNGKEGLELEYGDLSDVFTVCTLNDKGETIFVASFFVTEISKMKFAYVANVKTALDHRNQGLATKFFDDLTDFMGIRLVDAYNKAYIVINSTEEVADFYKRRGFVNAPLFLSEHWAYDNHTLMVKTIKDNDGRVIAKKSMILRFYYILALINQYQCGLCLSYYGKIVKKKCCGKYCHSYCETQEFLKLMAKETNKDVNKDCIFCTSKSNNTKNGNMGILKDEQSRKRTKKRKSKKQQKLSDEDEGGKLSDVHMASKDEEEKGTVLEKPLSKRRKIGNSKLKGGQNEEEESDLTSKSQRSADRHVAKHCNEGECNEKKITGAHWARHLLEMHGDQAQNTVQFNNCYKGDCCSKGPEYITIKGKKHYQCRVCESFTRYDLFNKEQGHCKRVCRAYLSQEALDNLQNQDDIGMVEFHHNEESTVEEKAPSTSFFGSVSVVVNLGTTEGFLVFLKDIENKKKDEQLCVQQIIKHANMFTSDQIIDYLANGEHTNLRHCLFVVLDQYVQLNEKQICGILVASVILNDACWTKVQTIIKDCFKTFENLQIFFKGQLGKIITERYAEWLCNNWANTSTYQIKLILYMVSVNNTQISLDVLNFAALINGFVSQKFIDYTEALCDCPAAPLFLQCIKANHKQQKMEEYKFYDLCDLMKSSQSKQIITQYQTELISIPLLEWSTFIADKQQIGNVIDSSSIMEFFDKLSAAYGLNQQLTDNLVDPQYPDGRFFSMMHEVPVKPNNRQFAVAQYAIGKMQTDQRQVWIVPSGQGKSRITAATAAIALLVDAFTKVHIVFENEYLLHRDKQDFELFWLLLGYTEGIEVKYHVGINFKIQSGELAIIDEADCFIFNQSEQFMKLIKDTACICFTATPDNKDPDGVEARLLKAFGITKFNYLFANDEKEDKQEKFLAIDLKRDLQVIESAILSNKITFIQQKMKEGPVIVFCDDSLKKSLVKSGLKIVCVEEDHDDMQTNNLKELDKTNGEGLYPLIITTSTFGMRGIDYRSQSVPIHLIIAKSFDTERDALQGLNRVGRFGDSCTRSIFADTLIIDQKAQITNKGKIQRFLASVDNQKVQVKQIKVKELATKVSKNYGAKNQKRANQLVSHRQSSQLQLEQVLGQLSQRK